jgi:D-alanyl-D-alanine carboxypeptidase
VGEQVAMAQTTPVPPSNSANQYSNGTVLRTNFNRDPRVVRAIVEGEASDLQTQAVEFGMWVNEDKVLTLALGESMTGVPARTTMHYRIGGIAETFMSTLLLILAQEQRIDLDKPILKWFPGLLGADQVTPRMLVANTAGYIDYVYVTDFTNLELAQPFRAFTDDELIHYSVRDGQMMFAPGTSQHYSHTDNVILGQFIERATGKTIEQWYAEKLFGPLGMTNTYFPVNQNIRNPVLHAFTSDRSTKEHKVYEDCTYWNPSWGSTPGLPISDLDDLGKWGPAFGTGRLLTPELFKEQIAPTSVGLGTNKPDLYFAFGFVVANGWFVQNPVIDGYSGAFAYKPSIAAEATQSDTATSSTAGFEIIRQVSRYIDPSAPINF